MNQPASKLYQLYDADFCEWTSQTADYLRRRCFNQVDVEHLAEEIEDMGKSRQRELRSRIERILEHLIKLDLPASLVVEYNESGWRRSVRVQQEEVRKLLEESPSLTRLLTPDLLAASYQTVALWVAEEYGCRVSGECPYRWKDVRGK